MRLLVTPTFARTVKKLHPQQKAALDAAIRAIAEDPSPGETKLGDLARVRVFKFRIESQVHLLAYGQPDSKTLELLALGSHENFYRDLKR